jgi:hypothetical protein
MPVGQNTCQQKCILAKMPDSKNACQPKCVSAKMLIGKNACLTKCLLAKMLDSQNTRMPKGLPAKCLLAKMPVGQMVFVQKLWNKKFQLSIRLRQGGDGSNKNILRQS